MKLEKNAGYRAAGAMRSGCARTRVAAFVRLAALLLLFSGLLAAGGHSANAQMEHPSLQEAEKIPSSYELLEQSLTESLNVEQQQLKEFFRELGEAREFEQLCRERLDAYRIQLSAHRNILVLPTMAAYELRNAHGQHLATLNKLSERTVELEERLGDLRRQKENISGKLNSYQEQFKEAEEEAARSGQPQGIRSQ